MGKKVKALTSFIGSFDEMKLYSGNVPDGFKNKEKLTTNDIRNMFGGKINEGAIMDLKDERADELSKVGLVVIIGDSEKTDEVIEAEKPVVKPAEKSTVKVISKGKGK